jgi:hypothetical protein
MIKIFYLKAAASSSSSSSSVTAIPSKINAPTSEGHIAPGKFN